jgi:hypothetical protein
MRKPTEQVLSPSGQPSPEAGKGIFLFHGVLSLTIQFFESIQNAKSVYEIIRQAQKSQM